MQRHIRFAEMALAAMLLIILGSGCASSPSSPSVATSASQSQSGIFVKQVPMTSYMRSQVGTPNELSPLAPPQASNVRQVGGQWLCDLNGQTMAFDPGTSCWVPAGSNAGK
jgi:hypothetical protein